MWAWSMDEKGEEEVEVDKKVPRGVWCGGANSKYLALGCT